LQRLNQGGSSLLTFWSEFKLVCFTFVARFQNSSFDCRTLADALIALRNLVSFFLCHFVKTHPTLLQLPVSQQHQCIFACAASVLQSAPLKNEESAARTARRASKPISRKRTHEIQLPLGLHAHGSVRHGKKGVAAALCQCARVIVL